VSLAFGLAAVDGAAAQQQFNGRWSVEVVTERGACDRAYRFPVVIERGRIRYGGPESLTISGTVTARGAVRSSIAADGMQADVTGRLSGATGTGTWEIAGGRSCGGTWNAERRG
jgi:hypothetical protein